MQSREKNLVVVFAALIIIAAVLFVFSTKAEATEGDDICTEVITVVDEEAWTEEILHPEVTEVIHHDAVTETTPAIWANWSPNNTQGPQDYVPIWPVDERGTWHIHTQGIPGGHEGPDGVYQQGGGNSPWFYRQAEQVTVISEAYDEIVVVSEAWTEYVEHPEVSHEETIEVECEDDEQPDPVVTQTSSTQSECGDDTQTVTTVTTTTEYVLVDGVWVLGDPVEETTTSTEDIKVVPCDNPDIEQPGPDEEITYQAFDGQGNLVEQRVSKPIDPAAKQEGM